MKNFRIAPLTLLVLAAVVGFGGALLGAHVTKVYFEDGGNKLIVADGGVTIL